MRNIILFCVIAVFTATLTSCDNNQTYAEQLDAEQALIKDFIDRQGITVVTTMPTKFPWDENVYYKTKSGLYFRLVNQGDINSKDSVEKNNLVVARYLQYTLDVKADTLENTNSIQFPFPSEFKYLDYSVACTGWHEAVGLMKRNNAEAKIIVYSKLGFSNYLNSVTPIGYDMKIRIMK